MLKNSSYTFLMVTLATVSFYAWSVAHFNAFLTVFDLNYTVLERSFYQTLYYGFMHSFDNIFIVLAYILVIFFLVSVVVSNSPDLIGFIDKKRRCDSFESVPVPPFVLFSKKILYSCLSFILVLFLFLLSMAYVEKDGQNRGLEMLANLNSIDEGYKPIVNVKIDGKNKYLFFIVCGSVNCAGMDLESDYIYYFPLVSGFSFKYNRVKLLGD